MVFIIGSNITCIVDTISVWEEKENDNTGNAIYYVQSSL